MRTGLHVDDQGMNNLIDIHQKTELINCNIKIKGNNNQITIGENLLISKLHIRLKGNNKRIDIDNGIRKISNLKIVSIRKDNQALVIGKNFSCGGLELQMNDGNEVCSIGDDCLFSWGIKMRTSDGHSIVDLNSDKATNQPENISIGDRVWVGEDVKILKGVEIPNDSVVSSFAVITKKFTKSFTVIGGFPARILKEGVKWDRRMPSEYNERKEK